MISDKEWLRKLGKWIDRQDESFGERELRNYMMLYDFTRLQKALEKKMDEIKAMERRVIERITEPERWEE